MPQFQIDDDVVELISRTIQPRPFESMSAALERFFRTTETRPISDKVENIDVDRLLAELNAVPDDVFAKSLPTYTRKGQRLKAPSPSALQWKTHVTELRSIQGLTTWKSICDHLGIDTRGDSARRRLREWVKVHRPNWSAVPEV